MGPSYLGKFKNLKSIEESAVGPSAPRTARGRPRLIHNAPHLSSYLILSHPSHFKLPQPPVRMPNLNNRWQPPHNSSHLLAARVVNLLDEGKLERGRSVREEELGKDPGLVLQ